MTFSLIGRCAETGVNDLTNTGPVMVVCCRII